MRLPAFQNEVQIESKGQLLPVARAIQDGIANLKQQSDAPVIVVCGEVHDVPAQALLPYAYLRLGGAGLQHDFAMGLELPHTSLSQIVSEDLGLVLKPGQAEMLDRQFGRNNSLLTALASRVYEASPHATDLLLRTLKHQGVPTQAVDARRISLSDRDDLLVDLSDTLTARFSGMSGKPVIDSSPEGMEIRNKVMAYHAEQLLTASGVVWLQVGAEHVVGFEENNRRAYEASLGGQLAPLVEAGRASLLAVFSDHQRRLMPMNADVFPGSVITYTGLDCRVTEDVREYTETCRMVDRFHKAGGLKAVVSPECLTGGPVRQRQLELRQQVSQWLASLS